MAAVRGVARVFTKSTVLGWLIAKAQQVAIGKGASQREKFALGCWRASWGRVPRLISVTAVMAVVAVIAVALLVVGVGA